MPGLTDCEAELDLEGVRRGCRDALRAFFDVFHPRVHDLAYRLSGEQHAAEDLAQDVFLKLWQVRAQMDTERNPWPWLVTITLNRFRDRCRRDQRRPRASSEGEVPLSKLAVDGQSEPAGVAISRERDRRVQEALGRLSPDHRVTVILRDYEGFDYEDIATISGVSSVAVRKRYSRAIEALGKLLGEVEL